MKRGIKILIVVVVALATNFGLHAAFGWGGHNRNCHHQNYHHGYHHHGYDKNHHGCANPWNTYGEQETTKQDTLVR